MYVPNIYAVADRRELVAFIERHPFGTLVSTIDGKPFATHAPFIVFEDGESLTLALHLAKANPQWRGIEGQEVLAIFQGPHAFISAEWSEQPKTNVPTWNYSAVHCLGHARVADATGTLEIVERIVEQFEPAWRMNQAQPEYMAGMQKAIVGITLAVTAIEGKYKYGQTRTPEERLRIAKELDQSARASDLDVAREMRALL